MPSSLETVEAYLRAIEQDDDDGVAALLHPAIEQHEYPNQLVVHGATRDRDQLLQGLEAGRRAVRQQRYEILDALVDGDRVALRVRWSATLGVPLLGKQVGERLEARFGVFLRVVEGRIREQHNYDCFVV